MDWEQARPGQGFDIFQEQPDTGHREYNHIPISLTNTNERQLRGLGPRRWLLPALLSQLIGTIPKILPCRSTISANVLSAQPLAPPPLTLIRPPPGPPP